MGKKEISEKWEEEGVVISGNYADADVVETEDGNLRMYYALEPEVPGFEGQVYSAISSDGSIWRKEKGIRMKWATFPSVIKLSDGRWRMYYQGMSESTREFGIVSAISHDGLNWIQEEGIRIKLGQEGLHDTKMVASPTVIRLSDGTYIMVYRGSSGKNRFGKTDPKTGEPAPIDYLISATSKDGLNWAPKAVVVDSRNEEMRDQIDGPELVLDGDKIKLYCNSYEGVYLLEISKDGKPLTSPEIVLPARKLHAPCDVTLIKFKGIWKMYFGIHTKGIFSAKRIN